MNLNLKDLTFGVPSKNGRLYQQNIRSKIINQKLRLDLDENATITLQFYNSCFKTIIEITINML